MSTQPSVTLLARVEQVARRPALGLDLSVYRPGTLEQLLIPVEQYLARPPAPPRRRWFPWPVREPEPTRVAPLLLSGPVGTGKTTLMMLLDRALPEASCASLFQQQRAAHPSTAGDDGVPAPIEVRPLALMGHTHNLPTGVVRLSELRTFFRLFTYDRRTARRDPQAAEQFAALFQRRIVYVDEFVPDVVTSFPMGVINHLADHGVLVVLTSNRREMPFVEGVQVVPVEGDDLRVGNFVLVCRPAGPDPLFDAFEAVEPTSFERLASGLRARLREVAGQRWMYLHFDEVARVPAGWLAFQQLMQHADQLLVDAVPVFDPARAAGPDSARRFALLVDAIYDERRPVRVRLTNPEPLPRRFSAEMLGDLYLPEVLVDLERTISRLRQLSTLLPDET